MAVLEKVELLHRRRLQATGFRLQQKKDPMPDALTHLRFTLSAIGSSAEAQRLVLSLFTREAHSLVDGYRRRSRRGSEQTPGITCQYLSERESP
jgi:hypothetical protein